MTEEQKPMSESEKKKEDWMNSKWRPMMGWMYMLVCIMDFVLFPILWSLLQAVSKGQVNIQWQPITLQGAGLFHIAMGAVLGIAAYGRTQEKMSGANNGGISLPSTVGTTYTPPAAVPQPAASTIGTPTTSPWGSQPLAGGSSFGSAPTTGYGSSAGFGEGTPTTVTVVTGFGGKPAPVIPPFPER
jgi:hypothetical protein